MIRSDDVIAIWNSVYVSINKNIGSSMPPPQQDPFIRGTVHLTSVFAQTLFYVLKAVVGQIAAQSTAPTVFRVAACACEDAAFWTAPPVPVATALISLATIIAVVTLEVVGGG